MLRFLTTIALLALMATAAPAQDIKPLRQNCLATPSNMKEAPSGTIEGAFSGPRRLPTPRTQWDSTRVYPIAVMLVTFADRQFSMDDPADFYNRILNEQGYNEGRGPGCVTDYFQSQSAGWFHPRFDVYGPIATTISCSSGDRHGCSAATQAVDKMIDSLHVDFSPYDWDGDSQAEPLLIIFAGYGGNETATSNKGYVWPCNYSIPSVITGGIRLYNYAATCELWSNNRSCGIGTICHEYSHTLGLPDIYPTAGDEYSIVDEWDLMDGGNFVNNGWCPPNYSAHEKMLMGWLTPEVLTNSATITDLAPIDQGGNAYIIRCDSNANEFFLLENRQWNGWDLRTPGHGLLIAHVDYSSNSWRNNTVNNSPSHHRYDYVHADGLNYNAWNDIVGNENPHVGGHSRILSGTPYPYIVPSEETSEDSITNRAFTDSSIPAATTFCKPGLLGKPINGITEDEEGRISFYFLREVPDAIHPPLSTSHHSPSTNYDLQGRPVDPSKKGLVIRNGKIIFNH